MCELCVQVCAPMCGGQKSKLVLPLISTLFFETVFLIEYRCQFSKSSWTASHKETLVSIAPVLPVCNHT